MKKTILTLFALIAFIFTSFAQDVTPIYMARALPVGTVVTVEGIITNDASQMGWAWYIQDETAGIVGYSMLFTTAGAKQGDMVRVTGTLSNYNSLLEFNPVTEVVVLSSGNPLPDPVTLSIPQITVGTAGEDYEGMLVKVNNVNFNPAIQGTLFNAQTSGFNYYIYNSSNDSMQVRILPNTNINGTLIPMGKVNIVACMGQFSSSNPTAGYQLLPRTIDDITINSSIILTGPVQATDITNASVKLAWNTDNPGSTFVKYGLTTSLEKGTITGAGNTTDHEVTIPGSASQVLYARVYSVSNTVATDTAKSSVGIYITGSNSTGNIRVYFNTPVDHSVSTGTDAISIGKAVDDTLINYINRAKQTIDIAIYNFNNNGLSNISTALNNAASRGVKVRLVYCGTTTNAGIDELSSSVHTLRGPDSTSRSGIMHNKFMVVDAKSANAGDPVVWTGSVNWTDENMNKDANNVIIIQDQSLAITYTMEFEEMWGSATVTPNAALARFGKNKTNNTPHQLKIGGKWLECYFSPSDNVNAEIINRIRTAQTDLEAAVMTFTRKEMAYEIEDVATAGADVSFLTTSFSNLIYTSGTTIDSNVYKSLQRACYELGDYTGGGIMHNKYMIVDQSDAGSDPMVWTGSHNWTSSANNYNDENCVVVHDATLANIYYQNFVSLMSQADILYDIPEAGKDDDGLMVYPNPVSTELNVEMKAQPGSHYTVQMLDISGRAVSSEMLEATGNGIRTSIGVSHFKPGLYLLRIAGRDRTVTRKVMVK